MLLLVALDSAENQTVVEERDGVVLILENGHHCTLKYFWSLRHSEGKPTVEIPIKRCHEPRLIQRYIPKSFGGVTFTERYDTSDLLKQVFKGRNHVAFPLDR